MTGRHVTTAARRLQRTSTRARDPAAPETRSQPWRPSSSVTAHAWLHLWVKQRDFQKCISSQALLTCRSTFYTRLPLNVCISYWSFAWLVFCCFLIKKVMNTDHLKINCQMKRLQSGIASGFADMIQFKQLFSALNSNTGEW